MNFKMPLAGTTFMVGNVPIWDSQLQNNIERLTGDFQTRFEQRVSELGLNAATVRGLFLCNVTYLLDDDHLWLICEVAHGIPNPRKFHKQGDPLADSQIEHVATYELGYVDPFYAKIPRRLLSRNSIGEDEYNHEVLLSVDAMYQSRKASRNKARTHDQAKPSVWRPSA